MPIRSQPFTAQQIPPTGIGLLDAILRGAAQDPFGGLGAPGMVSLPVFPELAGNQSAISFLRLLDLIARSAAFRGGGTAPRPAGSLLEVAPRLSGHSSFTMPDLGGFPLTPRLQQVLRQPTSGGNPAFNTELDQLNALFSTYLTGFGP